MRKLWSPESKGVKSQKGKYLNAWKLVIKQLNIP